MDSAPTSPPIVGQRRDANPARAAMSTSGAVIEHVGPACPPHPPMSLVAFALVAAAAGAHATWNLLAKQARGGIGFVWLFGLVAATVYAPVAALQLVLGSRGVSAEGVAFMAGSGVLHSIYFAALQRGYAVGDLSVVYPLARGTGPGLSVVLAIVLLGERPGPLALAGAALVVVAVLSLARGGTSVPRRAAVGFALLTGATIAAYTLWDAYAVKDLDQPTVVYYWGSEVSRALLLATPALRDRAAVARAWREDRRAAIGVGVLSPLAYILVLVALTLAPVSIVAPAREASIVIVALLGTRLLGEGDPRRRLAAAAAIVAGIACLALA
jgi:drug/metabolite transporter (DMT)-like permease